MHENREKIGRQTTPKKKNNGKKRAAKAKPGEGGTRT
jgi:hypothetical protein